MKTLVALLGAIWIIAGVHAATGKAYLERFTAFSKWNQHLPEQPDSDFLKFIDSDTPLAQKLRERWLYLLVRQKNWVAFSQHYKNSEDISLQCSALLADYYQGKTQVSLTAAIPLWLSGDERPGSCSPLFKLLLQSEGFKEQLISQRIALALDKNNIALARFLLKQYQPPRLSDEKLLGIIHQNPTRISELNSGDLHDLFYLYGLKRLVAKSSEQAITFWNHKNTRKILPFAQQQAFIAHLALYKAMRHQDDAEEWFAKVKPAFYNDALLDWQIRSALIQGQWRRVELLINQSKDKENPCWQYWLARAQEALHQPEKAQERYLALTKMRHYYGFLASLRLNKKLSFQNENANNDKRLLTPYQPITKNVKSLYNSKQTLQASRLLNDFVLELSKNDKSALIHWIATDLNWLGKSVYLSNTEELNNQLSLRFPLPYNSAVAMLSNNYHLSQALIYAIIRQESSFRDDVVSPAGARGLMQLMPATATVVAKQEKIAYSHKNQLFLSQKNINIGSAYLKQLAKRYSGHPLLMAAAYNAGPRQVNYWIKNHPPKEMDLWIETLPWRETRNYLKNVISFYAVYQYRLRLPSDLSPFLQTIYVRKIARHIQNI